MSAKEPPLRVPSMVPMNRFALSLSIATPQLNGDCREATAPMRRWEKLRGHEFWSDRWVASGEEVRVISKFGKTAEPPFRANRAARWHGFEHVVDRQLKAQVSSSAKVAQIEKSIDDFGSRHRWARYLIKQFDGGVLKVGMEVRGCHLDHVWQFGGDLLELRLPGRKLLLVRYFQRT